MIVLTIFKESFGVLWSNKLRTSLTLIGIVIGVTCVMTVVGMADGLQRQFQQGFSSFTNNLTLFASRSDPALPSYSELTIEDLESIKAANFPALVEVSGVRTAFGEIADPENPNLSRGQNFTGVGIEYSKVNEIMLLGGRWFIENDYTNREKVTVLGYYAATDYFPNFSNSTVQTESPVGQTIEINGISFLVIGVTMELSASSGEFMLPFNIVNLIEPESYTNKGERPLDSIILMTNGDLDAARNSVTPLLQFRHGLTEGQADFDYLDLSSILDDIASFTNILRIVLGSIGFISLLVAGIGVMNVMLSAVAERVREVGIRRALGAKKKDIITQFLIESVVIGLLGGLIGIALTFILQFTINTIGIPGPGGQNFSIFITTTNVLINVGIAFAVGLVFGVYPSIRASTLNPIEALRHVG